MDPLSLLREKIERLTASRVYTGMLAVIKQLDIAGRHYLNGRNDGQDYLYTDALLRVDRAVNGALTEMYGFASGRDASEASGSQIEHFVLEEAGLPERSTALLAHHLKQWRRALENDLQFAAGDQDAYLAFLSAASVIGVLLDDLVRLEAYQGEKRRSEARKQQRAEQNGNESATDGDEPVTLAARLRHLLEAYARTFLETPEAGTVPTEDQLRGRLRGFLETVLPATSLLPDPPLRSPSGVLRPSFIVAEGDESVVLEVKRAVETDSAFERSFVTEQMMMYMLTSGIACGIIALLPDGGGELNRSEARFELDGRSHVIVTLRPDPS